MNIFSLSLFFVVVLAEDYDMPKAGRGNQRGCVFPTNIPPNLIIRMQSKGRIMRFICPSGSLLVGKRFSTCLRGRWSNQPPICISTGCASQTAPPNGRVTASYDGAMLTFGCNPGYIQNGSSTIYCALFQWNGTAPTCTVPTASPKVSCDFEEPDLCGWSHDITHDFEWKRHKFSTPSGHVGTGPSFDHTLGKGLEGHYIYLEASSPQKEGDITRFFSPVYPTTLSDSCFTFWYHMYGSSIGSLRVYLKGENQVLAELAPAWSKDNQAGDVWLQGQIEVPQLTINFQIVIEGVRGSDYMGDIAFDDVSLSQGTCSVQTDHSVQEGSVTGATTTDEGGGETTTQTSAQLATTSYTGEISTRPPLTRVTKDPFVATTFAIASETVPQTTSSSTSEQVANTPSTSRAESTKTVTTGAVPQSQDKDCLIDTSNSTDNSDQNWVISLSNCSSGSQVSVSKKVDVLRTTEGTTVEYRPTTIPSAALTTTSSSARFTTRSNPTESYTYFSTTKLQSDTTISPTTKSRFITPIFARTTQSTSTPISTLGATTQRTTSTETDLVTTKRAPYFPKYRSTAAPTTTTTTTAPPPPTITTTAPTSSAAVPTTAAAVPTTTTTTTTSRKITYTSTISLPTTSRAAATTTRRFVPLVTTTFSATTTTPPSVTSTRKPFIFIVPKTAKTETKTSLPSTTSIVQVKSTSPTTTIRQSTTTRWTTRLPTKQVSTPSSTTDIRSLFPDEDSEEVDDSGQSDDSNVDNASKSGTQLDPDSSERWRKFPKRKTKSSSAAGASAIATACSLGAVALVVSVFAVVYFVRKRKLQQKRFASNSEMRFITQSEELEIGLQDSSDMIKLI